MHFDARLWRRFPEPLGFAALALTLVALAALEAAGLPLVRWLRYERASLAAGDWWRLVTAHLVHYDARHLALNLAGLALLWALSRREASRQEWVTVVLIAMLGVDAGLYF